MTGLKTLFVRLLALARITALASLGSLGVASGQTISATVDAYENCVEKLKYVPPEQAREIIRGTGAYSGQANFGARIEDLMHIAILSCTNERNALVDNFLNEGNSQKKADEKITLIDKMLIIEGHYQAQEGLARLKSN